MSVGNIQTLYKKQTPNGDMTCLLGDALIAEMQNSTAQGNSSLFAFTVSILFGLIALLDEDKERLLLADLGWEAIAQVDTSTARPI